MLKLPRKDVYKRQHLERQGGGSGAGGGKGSVGLRGPGETQLEMDRRIILNLSLIHIFCNRIMFYFDINLCLRLSS